MKKILKTLLLTLGFIVGMNVQSQPVITGVSEVPWLTIQSQVGITNQIQYSTNLNPTNWTALTNLVVATNPYWFFDVSATGTQRFYRVIQPTNSTPIPPTPVAGMVAINDGSFTMGDASKTSGNGPAHTVNVSGFLMDSNLVSYSTWVKVYSYATTHGYSFTSVGSGKTTNNPVQSVNWYDAVKWCNARSEMEGLTPCYYTLPDFSVVYRSGNVDLLATCVKWTANGYRLPTEAEWEKAAKGTLVGQRFPWGNTIDQMTANYQSFGSKTVPYDLGTTQWNPIGLIGGTPCTSPVGSFKANKYGLNDMSGNVEEWCWDWYASNYYSASPASDPLGSSVGTSRVTRGGSWVDVAPACQDFARNPQSPKALQNTIGFRCVKK